MNHEDRRKFLQRAVLGLAAGTVAVSAQADDAKEHEGHEDHEGHDLPLTRKGWYGNETIAMLIYPGFTALDLFGPHHIFISMMGAKVLLVAKDDQPVLTDTKIKIHPTATFANCPEKISVFFVPGGTAGTLDAARDEATRTFVRERGGKADWITSVCTGSILLGAAGLLKGYKATSHWLAVDDLKWFGAIPTHERVVVDRNRVTGAGVTSGLDFALQLAKEMRSEEFAQAVQLFCEYDPHPPLDAGSPEKAPKEMVKLLRSTHRSFNRAVEKLARETQS